MATSFLISNSGGTPADPIVPADGSQNITGNLVVSGTITEGGVQVGNVDGAASSTDNAIARFDGTGGKNLQNSGATIADNGKMIVTTSDDDTVLVLRSPTNSNALEFYGGDTGGPFFGISSIANHNIFSVLVNPNGATTLDGNGGDTVGTFTIKNTSGAAGHIAISPNGDLSITAITEIDKNFASDAAMLTIQDNNQDRFKFINRTGTASQLNFYHAGNLEGFIYTPDGGGSFNIETNTNVSLNLTTAGTGDINVTAADTINLASEVRFSKAIQSATLSGNAFTITSPRADITAESGGVDQLDTVNGLEDGQIIWLKGATGQTITVAEAGNIKVAGATVVLSTTLWTQFMYDGTQGKLVQISAVLTD